MPEVLLVAGRDPRDEPGGGHSSYVRAHGRAALRAGYTPHLVCVGASGETAETDYGVIHRAASPARPYRQILIAIHGPILARASAALAADRAIALLHGFGVWGWAAVSARDRLKKRGIPAQALVGSYTTYADESWSRVEALSGVHTAAEHVRFRGEDAFSRLAVRPFERRAYLGADLLLVNYDSVRRLVEARYGPLARCRRIGYASERAFLPERAAPLPPPAAFLESLAPRDAPLIVSVSRHEPRKGIDVLIDALAQLKSRGVPFRACLAAEGPLLETHRSLAARLGLGDAIALPGFVEDLGGLLGHADVFVLPSRREQSGSLAVLEALQAGLPVVASGCDGIPEDLTDAVDALLVAPGDPAALASALARLLGDADLRRGLGAAARRTFLERFSADAFSGDIGTVYREMEDA